MRAPSDGKETMARLILIILALGATASVHAQGEEFRLRYTLLDFNFLFQDTPASGIQADPVLQQTVSIDISDGSGVGVRGSFQLPANFFLIGDLSSTIIDLDGRITNPISDVNFSDDFNFRQSSLGLGYAVRFNDNVHLVLGATYDTTNYDIGTIANQSFATSDSGLGGRLGLRGKVGRNLELDGYARYTEVGTVDFNTRTLDTDTLFGVNILYYIGSAFAVGAWVEVGEINSTSVTLRYAFGRTRVGR